MHHTLRQTAGVSQEYVFHDIVLSKKATFLHPDAIFPESKGAAIANWWFLHVDVRCNLCAEVWKRSFYDLMESLLGQVGEFQCYDQRALASLAESASRVGHPEWGQTGPHDSGEYNSHPEVEIYNS